MCNVLDLRSIWFGIDGVCCSGGRNEAAHSLASFFTSTAAPSIHATKCYVDRNDGIMYAAINVVLKDIDAFR